jgi:hypothetical protein
MVVAATVMNGTAGSIAAIGMTAPVTLAEGDIT